MLLDKDKRMLEDLGETNLASLKRSEAKALDHYLSRLIETIAAE